MKKLCLMLTAVFVASGMVGCSSGDDVIFTTPQPTEPLVSIIDEPSAEAPTQETQPDITPTPESQINALPEGVSLETMTAAEKREVNLFLSNFGEVSYKRSPTTDAEDQLYFAFNHNRINNKKFNDYVYGSEFRISAALVDSTLNRFFGQSIAHAEPAGKEWRYENGYYYTVAADGESVAYFTVAKELTDNRNGTYTVLFDVFMGPEPHDPIDSSWYSLSHDQASSRFEQLYGGTAVIKPKTHNGSATYELVDYDVS